jgi:D-galacturonate reductase
MGKLSKNKSNNSSKKGTPEKEQVVAAAEAAPLTKRISKKREGAPNAIIFGTGEYTTGYVNNEKSKSDKGVGVVGLVHFDLRSRGKIGERVVLVGTNGKKFAGIREHFKRNIDARFKNLTSRFESFPEDSVASDTRAFEKGIASMESGDVASVFTPDDTHFEIAMAALEKGLHVMVTKPIVKNLEEHR